MMALRARALVGNNLGELAIYENQLKVALPFFERAVEDWKSFLRLDPGNTIAFNNHGSSSTALAFTLEGLGRPADAARVFRAAVEMRRMGIPSEGGPRDASLSPRQSLAADRA